MPKIAITTLRILALAMIFLIITANNVFADSLLTMAPSSPATALHKVEISEIFPDPKGKDKGSEWVELYNDSENNIDLLGWKLNNGGKKDITIKNPLIIGAGNYLVLEKENLKLALKNTNGQLKLIDTDGNLIDKAVYGKAQEGKSFSKIFFRNFGEADDGTTAAAATKKSKWSWNNPTKNQENDVFYILEGEIISGPSDSPAANDVQSDKLSKSISISVSGKSPAKILDLKLADNQNILLLTTILRPKTIARFLVNKNGVIQDFKIKNPREFPSTKNQNQENWIKYYLIILIALCIIPLQLTSR